MKKYIKIEKCLFIILAIFLIPSGFFSACTEKEETKETENVTKAYHSIKEGRYDFNENEFVSMSVLCDGVFVDSSVKLLVENNTQGELSFGEHFSLEYFEKENWTEIQLDFLFTDIGIFLKAGNTKEKQFYVLEKYLQKTGRYRIVKSFGLFKPDRMYPEAYEDFILSAEFEIK